ADVLYARLREAEMPDLSRLNQFLDGASHIFYRDAGVNTVLVKQIDHVRPEPLERTLDSPLDVIGTTIHTARVYTGIRIDVPAEFRGDHHLIADGSEGFTHDFFVCEWAVGFSGVEKCDAMFHGCTDEGDAFLLVWKRGKGSAHPHAAKSERRDFQV